MGASISLLDVFGRGFVLLAGRKVAAWCRLRPGSPRGSDIALDAHRSAATGPGRTRPVGSRSSTEVGPAGVALIRPDGFVAWRTRAADDDAEAVLTATLARVLAR